MAVKTLQCWVLNCVMSTPQVSKVDNSKITISSASDHREITSLKTRKKIKIPRYQQVVFFASQLLQTLCAFRPDSGVSFESRNGTSHTDGSQGLSCNIMHPCGEAFLAWTSRKVRRCKHRTHTRSKTNLWVWLLVIACGCQWPSIVVRTVAR